MSRTSRSEWAKRVQRWAESGLTAKEFAAETGLKASTLSFWKWRLGSEQRAQVAAPEMTSAKRGRRGTAGRARPSVPTFVEVTPASTTPRTPSSPRSPRPTSRSSSRACGRTPRWSMTARGSFRRAGSTPRGARLRVRAGCPSRNLRRRRSRSRACAGLPCPAMRTGSSRPPCPASPGTCTRLRSLARWLRESAGRRCGGPCR